LHFARRLAAERNHLTIIAHAFSIAAALAANPLHKVLLLPGQYDGREGLISGPDTIDALQKYRASKCFLGASGLTAEGPSDASVGPGLIYGAMMRRSAESVILADHTKFGRASLAHGQVRYRLSLTRCRRPNLPKHCASRGRGSFPLLKTSRGEVLWKVSGRAGVESGDCFFA
jgi:hypothetical protein